MMDEQRKQQGAMYVWEKPGAGTHNEMGPQKWSKIAARLVWVGASLAQPADGKNRGPCSIRDLAEVDRPPSLTLQSGRLAARTNARRQQIWHRMMAEHDESKGLCDA